MIRHATLMFILKFPHVFRIEQASAAQPLRRQQIVGQRKQLVLQPLRDRAPTRDSASGAQRQREADARTLLAGHVPKRGIV